MLPNRADGRPETATLRKIYDARGERPKEQDECQEGQSKPQKPVANKARKALAFQRGRSEVSGEQKKEAHKIGLIGGAEKDEQHARRRARRLNLAPKPAADGAVSNGGVVQDYQGHHY